MEEEQGGCLARGRERIGSVEWNSTWTTEKTMRSTTIRSLFPRGDRHYHNQLCRPLSPSVAVAFVARARASGGQAAAKRRPSARLARPSRDTHLSSPLLDDLLASLLASFALPVEPGAASVVCRQPCSPHSSSAIPSSRARDRRRVATVASGARQAAGGGVLLVREAARRRRRRARGLAGPRRRPAATAGRRPDGPRRATEARRASGAGRAKLLETWRAAAARQRGA